MRITGYSLVELVIVILIVMILAAIATPLLRGKIDAAKWTEGRMLAGIIAVAIRTWAVGVGGNGSWNEDTLPSGVLGLRSEDLNGTYFKEDDFSWQVDYNGGVLTYSVTVARAEEIYTGPAYRTLDNAGQWD